MKLRRFHLQIVYPASTYGPDMGVVNLGYFDDCSKDGHTEEEVRELWSKFCDTKPDSDDMFSKFLARYAIHSTMATLDSAEILLMA